MKWIIIHIESSLNLRASRNFNIFTFALQRWYFLKLKLIFHLGKMIYVDVMEID